MQGCPCENVTHYRELYEMQVSVLTTSGSKSKKFQLLSFVFREQRRVSKNGICCTTEA